MRKKPVISLWVLRSHFANWIHRCFLFSMWMYKWWPPWACGCSEQELLCLWCLFHGQYGKMALACHQKPEVAVSEKGHFFYQAKTELFKVISAYLKWISFPCCLSSWVRHSGSTDPLVLENLLYLYFIWAYPDIFGVGIFWTWCLCSI